VPVVDHLEKSSDSQNQRPVHHKGLFGDQLVYVYFISSHSSLFQAQLSRAQGRTLVFIFISARWHPFKLAK